MKNTFFNISVGLFFTHELDAISNHEWRVLPLTSWLPDEYGNMVFLFLHIPLFAILVALITSANEKVRIRSKIGISIFLLIHALLHGLFIGSEGYEFSVYTSNILIFGGAIFGASYLMSEYMSKRFG